MQMTTVSTQILISILDFIVQTAGSAHFGQDNVNVLSPIMDDAILGHYFATFAISYQYKWGNSI